MTQETHHIFTSKATLNLPGQQDVSLPSQRCGALFGNGLAGDCAARSERVVGAEGILISLTGWWLKGS